jgi:hypothetical protein
MSLEKEQVHQSEQPENILESMGLKHFNKDEKPEKLSKEELQKYIRVTFNNSSELNFYRTKTGTS